MPKAEFEGLQQLDGNSLFSSYFGFHSHYLCVFLAELGLLAGGGSLLFSDFDPFLFFLLPRALHVFLELETSEFTSSGDGKELACVEDGMASLVSPSIAKQEIKILEALFCNEPEWFLGLPLVFILELHVFLTPDDITSLYSFSSSTIF